MKHLLTLLIFLFVIHKSSAQFDKHSTYYVSGELSLGNYTGIDISLNSVNKEQYSFKLGYSGNFRKPESQPENYSSGLTGLFSFGLANPYDQVQNIYLAIGKIYNLNKKGTIRANLSIGLGYTTIREPENWEMIDDAFLTENYTWNYYNYHTVSVILNPKIEFPFTRIYGLTISPMVQLNKDKTFYGIGIGQMIGLLRKRNTNHNDVEN